MLSASPSKLWLTLGICALLFACTLTYPFNNDNALYAYMAELALHGRLPYVGSWDQNFPGIIFIHAAQILVSGHSQLAFHIFDVLLQLVGSFVLFRLGTRLYDERAGMLAAILACLYYIQQGLWMAGERDAYVSILLLLALYLSMREGKGWIVGLLCGFTFLFRPTYALYSVVFVVGYLTDGSRRKEWLRVILGASIPTILLLLIYLATGGLRDLYEATILFNLRVYGGVGTAFSFWEPIRVYWPAIVAVVIACVYFWQHNRNFVMLWSGLFASSVISLILLYRHSVYHYHPAMTLFLLLSAVGWISLADSIKTSSRWVKLVVPAAVVLLFTVQTFRGNTIKQVLIDLFQGRIHSLKESYAYYEGSPEFGTSVQTEVGEYLRRHTDPGESVQMFGPYSYPQYYAGLGSTSRFQTLHAIAMRGKQDSLQAFQVRWRSEYLSSMRAHSPKYFIVCDAPEAFRQYYSGRLGHEILQADFVELGNWLDSNYIAETKIGAFTLYRIRPDSLKP